MTPPNHSNNVTCFPHECFYKQEEQYIYNMLADLKASQENVERKLDLILFKLDQLSGKIERLDMDERQTQDAVLALTRKLLDLLDKSKD